MPNFKPYLYFDFIKKRKKNGCLILHQNRNSIEINNYIRKSLSTNILLWSNKPTNTHTYTNVLYFCQAVDVQIWEGNLFASHTTPVHCTVLTSLSWSEIPLHTSRSISLGPESCNTIMFFPVLKILCSYTAYKRIRWKKIIGYWFSLLVWNKGILEYNKNKLEQFLLQNKGFNTAYKINQWFQSSLNIQYYYPRWLKTFMPGFQWFIVL